MLAHQHGFIVVYGEGSSYGGVKTGQQASTQTVNGTDRYTTGGVSDRVSNVTRGKRKGINYLIKVL